jgi:hypothetical protein
MSNSVILFTLILSLTLSKEIFQTYPPTMKLWSSSSVEVLTISSARMNTICGLLLQRAEVTASRRHTSLKIIIQARVFTYGESK